MASSTANSCRSSSSAIRGEFVGVGFDDVDPDHGAVFLEVFGKLVGVEVGVGQDAVDVAAGASHGLTVLGDARRRADPGGVFPLWRYYRTPWRSRAARRSRGVWE